MQGDGRLDGSPACTVVDQPGKPAGDLAPRLQDDTDENAGQDHAVGQVRSVESSRRGQQDRPGLGDDGHDDGQIEQAEEPVGAHIADRRNAQRGLGGAQIDAEQQHIGAPGHQTLQDHRGELGLQTGLNRTRGLGKQDPQPQMDDRPERQEGEAVEDRGDRHAPGPACRRELPGEPVTSGARQAPDGAFGQQSRAGGEGEQAQIGPCAPSYRGRQVEAIGKPGEVRADCRISGQDPRDLAEGRDHLPSQQRLRIGIARICRRRRGRRFRHQPLLRQGLKDGLADRFHELVILRLGHSRRGRVRLGLGLAQNEA